MKWEEVLTLARRANDHYSLTEREQHLLWELVVAEVPEGGLIVELGLCWGKTAVVLALAAKQKQGRYWGLDNWSLEGSYEEVERLLWETVGGDDDPRTPPDWSWALTKGNTGEHWDAGQPVDFLLIDAGHDEVNVTKDCEMWIPSVAPGGLVAFDDVPSGPGWREHAHHAVREQMEKWTGDWENAASWGKLWIRRKPLP